MEKARRDARLSARAALALAGAVLALAAAGCGGGGDELSKDEYEREVAKALGPARAGLGAVRTGKLRSRTEAAAVLAGVAGPLANAARKIETIDAPKDAEGPQRQFVAAIRAFAIDSLRSGQALERGGSAALRRRGGIVRPQTARQLRAASEAYRAQGYEIGNALSPGG